MYPSQTGDPRLIWLSFLGPMVFVLPHTFTLFCLPTFWLWAYLRNMHYELLVFVLCLVYPRSHRGRDKPNQPILCIQYCLFPRGVHSWLPFRFSLTFIFDLCLVYPVLPVSLECPFLIAPSAFSNVYLRPVSCVPGVASVSRVSILDCPLGFL